MPVMRIRKVEVLPGTYEPSTMYLVTTADPSFFKMYVSSADGTAIRRLPSNEDIQSWISIALGGYNSAVVVATIAARNALELTANTQVLVLDATADTSVAVGAATYIYDVATATWTKISEAESMDAIQNWNNVVGKPASSPADIDQAVGQRHTHANKVVLDRFSDINGTVTYNGEPIRAFVDEEAW